MRSSNSSSSHGGSKAGGHGLAAGALTAKSEWHNQRRDKDLTGHAPGPAVSSAKSSKHTTSSSGSVPHEQPTVVRMDAAPAKGELARSISESMKRMFPTAQHDNQGEASKSAVSRKPAGCGEEFIVSPSPLAIALASRKASYSGPADSSLAGASSSNTNPEAPQRLDAPIEGTRRARSLHDASNVRLPIRSIDQGERQAFPSSSSHRRPLLIAPPPPTTHTSSEQTSWRSGPSSRAGSGLSERPVAPPSASQHKSAASSSMAPVPTSQPPAGRDLPSKELPSGTPLRGSVEVPPILAEWMISPDAAGLLSKVLELGAVRARLQGVEQGAVHFEAEEQEALQEAHTLLEVRQG